jgi:hypothetical protein
MLTEKHVQILLAEDAATKLSILSPQTVDTTTISASASAKTTQTHTVSGVGEMALEPFTSTVSKVSSKIDLQQILFAVDTGRLASRCLSFLSMSDRLRAFGLTSVAFRRIESVDFTLTKTDFKLDILKEILDVLEDPTNKNLFQIKRNPSGFLRLNNDLINLIKNKHLLGLIPDAAELRLNFWPGDLYSHLGAKIVPESTHTHPGAFFSFIVEGAYLHGIYRPSTNTENEALTVIRGTKFKGNKKFETLPEKHYLEPLQEEVVQSTSNYAYFSNSIIHKVIRRLAASNAEQDHGTLSVNTVFDAPKSEQTQVYNLYKNKPEDFIEEYETLPQELATDTLETIKVLLRNKIKSLTVPKAPTFVTSEISGAEVHTSGPIATDKRELSLDLLAEDTAEMLSLDSYTNGLGGTPVVHKATVGAGINRNTFFGADHDSFNAVVGAITKDDMDAAIALPDITPLKNQEVATESQEIQETTLTVF